MAEYGKEITSEIVSSINSKQSFVNNNTPANKLKVPQKDLLVFFRQLSVILQSGVPLAQGLFLLSENMTNKKFAICIQNIADQLNAGEELSASLCKYPRIFAPITVGLIEAGEAGGAARGEGAQGRQAGELHQGRAHGAPQAWYLRRNLQLP